MNVYQIVRSCPLSAASLVATIQALQQKYRICEFEGWRGHRHEFLTSIRCQLPPLTAITEDTKQIVLSTHLQEADCDSELEELLLDCEKMGGRAGGVVWDAFVSPRCIFRNGTSWLHDFSIGAGLASDGYWIKISVSNESKTGQDTALRRELFRNAIRLWGLSDGLIVENRNDDFTISAFPPLNLRYLDNRPENLSPMDFRVSGLTSLAQGIQLGRAARDAMAQRVVATRMGCTLNRDQYDSLFTRFNSIHIAWIVEVWGALTREAVAILDGGEISTSSPTWIPAFLWWEDSANARIFGSVTIEDGQRYLEVATDGGSLELLQERVSFLEDVHFTPVFP